MHTLKGLVLTGRKMAVIGEGNINFDRVFEKAESAAWNICSLSRTTVTVRIRLTA